MAKLAQLDGYHCVAALTERGDVPRLAAAMAELGGAGADLADPTATPHYMTLADPDPAAEAERLDRLVVAIKTWRPEVIVTDPAGTTPRTKAALARVAEAVKRAAVADGAHAARGLAPHAITKVVALEPAGPGALDGGAFVPDLGESLADYAEPASLLLPGQPAPPRVVKYATISGPPGDIAAGVALAAGGTARRELAPREPSADWLAARRQWHDARRALEALAAENTPQSRVKLLADLGKLPAPVLARAGAALGRAAERGGDPSAARSIYQLVADRAPLETSAAEAIHWLARHAASSELTRRVELGALPAPAGDAWEAVPEPAVRPASTLAPTPHARLRDPESVKDYYRRAAEWPARLAAFGPAAARDPFAHLAANAAKRKLGRDGDAAATLRALIEADPCDLAGNPMKHRLAEEARLLTPDGADNPAAPRLVCRTAPAPYLDGQLDERAWQNAPAAVLTHWAGRRAAKTCPTRVHATTDGQFLYLAVAATGPTIATNTTLDSQDRVELYLDLDRDYSSHYRIRVGADGTSDCDCGGRAWESGHFAAVHKGPLGWSAEVAIPLASLTGNESWGEVWCFDAVRVVPRRRRRRLGRPDRRPTRPAGDGAPADAARPEGETLAAG